MTNVNRIDALIAAVFKTDYLLYYQRDLAIRNTVYVTDVYLFILIKYGQEKYLRCL
jgi:hypothetical protein